MSRYQHKSGMWCYWRRPMHDPPRAEKIRKAKESLRKGKWQPGTVALEAARKVISLPSAFCLLRTAGLALSADSPGNTRARELAYG